MAKKATSNWAAKAKKSGKSAWEKSRKAAPSAFGFTGPVGKYVCLLSNVTLTDDQREAGKDYDSLFQFQLKFKAAGDGTPLEKPLLDQNDSVSIYWDFQADDADYTKTEERLVKTLKGCGVKDSLLESLDNIPSVINSLAKKGVLVAINVTEYTVKQGPTKGQKKRSIFINGPYEGDLDEDDSEIPDDEEAYVADSTEEDDDNGSDDVDATESEEYEFSVDPVTYEGVIYKVGGLHSLLLDADTQEYLEDCNVSILGFCTYPDESVLVLVTREDEGGDIETPIPFENLDSPWDTE